MLTVEILIEADVIMSPFLITVSTSTLPVSCGKHNAQHHSTVKTCHFRSPVGATHCQRGARWLQRSSAQHAACAQGRPGQVGRLPMKIENYRLRREPRHHRRSTVMTNNRVFLNHVWQKHGGNKLSQLRAESWTQKQSERRVQGRTHNKV